MITSRWSGAVLVCSALALISSEARAQDPPQPPQPPQETELVFDREVFSYPSFTRRNPFRPLLAADEGGPRYEQLSLIGIMYSDDPTASVAVLSTGGVTVAEDGTLSAVEGDAFYVKAGGRIGNVTVRAIHRDRVDVTVSEFDDLIPRTMVFVSRRQGGTP